MTAAIKFAYAFPNASYFFHASSFSRSFEFLCFQHRRKSVKTATRRLCCTMCGITTYPNNKRLHTKHRTKKERAKKTKFSCQVSFLRVCVCAYISIVLDLLFLLFCVVVLFSLSPSLVFVLTFLWSHRYTIAILIARTCIMHVVHWVLCRFFFGSTLYDSPLDLCVHGYD